MVPEHQPLEAIQLVPEQWSLNNDAMYQHWVRQRTDPILVVYLLPSMPRNP